MDILIGLLISLGVINGSGDVNAQISRNQSAFDAISTKYTAGGAVTAQGRWVTVIGGGGVIDRTDYLWAD